MNGGSGTDGRCGRWLDRHWFVFSGLAGLGCCHGHELRFTSDPGVGDGWPPAAVLDVLQAAREGVSNALRQGQAPQVDLALLARPPAKRN
jgi:hypothetical protein